MSRRRRRRRKRAVRSDGLMGLSLTGSKGLQAAPLPLADPLLAAAGARAEHASTWWSRRWLQALDGFGGLGAFAKSGNAARKEQVLATHIEAGIVLAQVQSPRPEPFIVRADVAPLSPETWEEAITFMAQRAVFAAKLLAGEMPEEIEEAFAEAGSSLLPRASADVLSTCTCGDPANPCKHTAAVYHLLAEEFGRDPFLIFKLRGCPKEQLLAALRVKRSGSGGPSAEAVPIPLPAQDEQEPPPTPQAFWHGGDAIRDFAINIAPPLNHAALLRQLGVPPIEGGEAFLDLMSALYRRIMESVLEDALKGQRPQAAPAASQKPKGAEEPVSEK